MAVIAAIDVAWSPTVNTFLLIVLGVVTLIRERRARAERTEIQQRTVHITKALQNVEHSITGTHRNPRARTREDDPDPPIPDTVAGE